MGVDRMTYAVLREVEVPQAIKVGIAGTVDRWLVGACTREVMNWLAGWRANTYADIICMETESLPHIRAHTNAWLSQQYNCVCLALSL